MNMRTRQFVQFAALSALLLTTVGCKMKGSADRKLALKLTTQGEMWHSEELNMSALAAFEMALEVNPRLMRAHLGIGDIHHVQGDYETAAKSYQTAVNIEPRNFKANYKLGLMNHLLNKVRDAIQSYLTALTIDPQSYEANLNLATAYLQIDQPQLGLPYAQAATKLKPDEHAAYVNLGSIYAALEQYPKAIESYDAALELTDDLEPKIALNMVDALTRTGKFQRAMNVLKVLSRNNPDEMVWERMGYVHFKMGQFKKSLEAYEKALAINPEDPASLNGVGVNLMAQYIAGRREDTSLRDRAISSWQKSIRVKPDQQRIIDLIARYRKL